MSDLIELGLRSLIQSGPIGVILAFMLWDNYQMKKKLFEVIENNTKEHQRAADIGEQTNKVIEKNTSAIIRQEEINKALKELIP